MIWVSISSRCSAGASQLRLCDGGQAAANHPVGNRLFGGAAAGGLPMMPRGESQRRLRSRHGARSQQSRCPFVRLLRRTTASRRLVAETSLDLPDFILRLFVKKGIDEAAPVSTMRHGPALARVAAHGRERSRRWSNG